MLTRHPSQRISAHLHTLGLLGLFAAFLFAGCVARPTSAVLPPEHGFGGNHLEASNEDLSSEPQPALRANVVTAHNRLGMLVFQHLLSQADPARADDGQNESVFVSPIGIALALGMAYNGAGDATAEAMAKALQLLPLLQTGLTNAELNAANLALLQALDTADSQSEQSSIHLDIANSLWYHQELAFNPVFLQDIQQNYRALIQALDFRAPESVAIINDWVSEATEGLIPQVVEQLDNDSIMLLINAVYFKGDWTTPFHPHRTRNMPFQLASADTRTVPMMYRDGRIEYYADDFQAIRLPYGDDARLAMYVFLPPANADFHEFARNFTYETMAQTFDQFRPAFGEVMLPRMEVSYRTQLNDALRELGMGIAFNPNAADFSRMLPTGAGRNVYMGDVIHQSVLKVDEEGTEAAAVTSVEFRMTSVPVYEFTFKADRPFLIAIRDDDTGALLFVGAIVDPGVTP